MFYDIFSALCAERGMSKNRAAKEIGLSNSTVTKWKKTSATPDSATLAKISKYFGVSMDFLLEIPPESSVMKKGESDNAELLQDLRDEERVLLQVTKGMTTEQIKKMAEFARIMKGTNAE